MKGPITVAKFGGSVLMDEGSVGKAADMIKAEVGRGSRLVIVVSALKGFTDHLLSLTTTVSPGLSGAHLDDILAMGEKTSARIMSAALSSRGLKSCVVDTESPYWPIVTDDKHGDAEPLIAETKKAVEEKLLPLIDSGSIPIVCGFIGKNKKGEVTTLGRGGSDTTAVVLGNYLKAEEVVLVKDVGSVFSADPSKVKGSVPLNVMSPEEAYTLTTGGAKILQAKALRYKESDLKIRVISLESQSLTSGGTVIGKGALAYQIECSDKPIIMMTIVGEQASNPQSLALLAYEVQRSKGEIVSIALDEKSSIFYISNGRDALKALHTLVVEKKIGKAVSSFEDLSMLTIKGRGLETNPGVIQRFVGPLSTEGINLYGLVTISSSIKVFVLSKEAERALTLLRRVLKEGRDEAR